MDESSSVGPRTNLALSAGILVACGLGWLATNALPSGLRVDPLGPAYYPRFVLLGLAALATALLVASLRELRRQPGRAEPVPTDPLPAQAASAATDGAPAIADEDALPPVSYPRMVGVLGLSIAYVLLMETLGYLISTLLYVVLLLLLLRVRNPWAVAGCALGIPLILDALFGRLLGIPLPAGLVEDLLP